MNWLPTSVKKIVTALEWYCMVLYSIELYCVVLPGYCMALYGIVWYFVVYIVLYGIAWYGSTTRNVHMLVCYCMVLPTSVKMIVTALECTGVVLYSIT